MIKQILMISLAIFAAAACINTTRDSLFTGDNQVAPTPTRVNIQNVQVSPGNILPPYGLKVKADIASFRISVTSSKDDITGRLEDIQQTIEQISTLAAEDDRVDLESTSVNQVSGSSDRESASSYWNIDSSSVTLKLTTSLTETSNDTLVESFTTFNNFLNTINLPETVSLQALSIGSEISDPEIYRPQLIAKVYQELEAIQTEYGEPVKFEVTGLHSGLKLIQLSDTEYYLYLEPAIIVKEF